MSRTSNHVSDCESHMVIEETSSAAWPEIWPIIKRAASEGESFPYPVDIREEIARSIWLQPRPARTIVVRNGVGRIVATAKMGRNQMGLGAHVATASFLVEHEARNIGIGRTLCQHSLQWARDDGYLAMQFNMVVSTNRPAIRLYQKLGFSIVGTIPKGFRHLTLGFVDFHIMHIDLTTDVINKSLS